MSPATPPVENAAAPHRVAPFFAAVIAITAAAVAAAVAQADARWSPGRLPLLLGLALAHAALHWRFPRLAARGHGALGRHFAVQAVLVIALGALSDLPVVTLTLALPVLGEALASLPRLRAAAVAVVVLGAAALHGVARLEPAELPRALLVGLVTVAFVAFYVEMFQRQALARQEAQAALRALDVANVQLRASMARVEALTLQAERQRFARELHDTLAQGLAGLLLQLEAMEAHLLRGDAAKTAAILAQSRERARATLAEARRAIDDLRRAPGGPALAEVLREEAARFAQATGIACTVDVGPGFELAPALAEHAQRCVTESLANCARHAGATQVRVSARREAGRVVLEVADDGVGFDSAEQLGRAGHYGLLGMRERARLAGGHLHLESAPGRGSVVRLELPAAEGARA